MTGTIYKVCTSGSYELRPRGGVPGVQGQYTYDSSTQRLHNSSQDNTQKLSTLDNVGKFCSLQIQDTPFSMADALGDGNKPMKVVKVVPTEIMKAMHASDNENAVFVLPSQLNGVEYTSHDRICNQVNQYKDDNTGGPRGQLAGHPAVAQFLLDSACNEKRPDGVSSVAKFLEEVNSELKENEKLVLQNGYLKLPTRLPESRANEVVQLVARKLHLIETLAFEGVPTTGLDHTMKNFSQTSHPVNIVYASAVPIGVYNNKTDSVADEKFQAKIARLILFAQYFGALKFATLLRTQGGGKVKILVMPLGGGVFRNSFDDIIRSFGCALEQLTPDEVQALDIIFMAFDQNAKEYQKLCDLLEEYNKYTASCELPGYYWRPTYGTDLLKLCTKIVTRPFKECLSWRCLPQLKKIIFTILTSLDPITDILFAITLFSTGNPWWGSFCVMCILMPTIVMTVCFNIHVERCCCSWSKYKPQRFKEVFGCGPNWLAIVFIDVTATMKKLFCCQVSTEEEAFTKLRELAEGTFESLPWSLFQLYIIIRQQFLEKNDVHITHMQLGISLFTSMFTLYNAYSYLDSRSDLCFEGDTMAFIDCLLELGENMAPLELIDDILSNGDITTHKDLSKLDHRGIRSIAKAMRESEVLKEINFKETKLDEWYKAQCAKKAEAYAKSAWNIDFCDIFCMNRSRLRKVTFTPALDIPGKWSYAKAFGLEEVLNGNQVVYRGDDAWSPHGQIGNSPLAEVIRYNTYNLVKQQITQNGGFDDLADEFANRAAIHAVKMDAWKSLWAILEVNPDRASKQPNLIWYAAQEAARGCLLLLLKCRAPVDTCVHKYTPLETACQQGHSKICRLLLEANANADSKDHSALCEACMVNNLDIVRMLLDVGASVHATKYRKRTPLHYCADYGAPRIAEALLAKRARLEDVDDNNDTPLTLSARRGTFLTLEVFVKAKANQKHKGLNGKTALEWATEMEFRKAKLRLAPQGDEDSDPLLGSP